LVTKGLLEKSKQKAVTKMMKPVKTKCPVQNYDKRKSPAAVKRTPRRDAGTPPTQEIVQAIARKRVVELEAAVPSCGCRHGDLNAFKSFTKAEAAYYGRPNKFLENRICLDCKRAVRDMKPGGRQQKAVVFYCDQGVKGYNAPDEDPMKDELTCNLVLCPQCEAARRIRFETGDTGSTGIVRKRVRRQVVV
jgi:hypothetical protein